MVTVFSLIKDIKIYPLWLNIHLADVRRQKVSGLKIMTNSA